MPGILTPPQRVSRLYSHTSAAKNGRPTHDAADIIVLGAAGDARSRALSPPARCHSFGRILPPSSHPSAQGSLSQREGVVHPSSPSPPSPPPPMAPFSDLKNESRKIISIFFIDASGGGSDGLPRPVTRRPTRAAIHHIRGNVRNRGLSRLIVSREHFFCEDKAQSSTLKF